MYDSLERGFTPVHATQLGIRYVLLTDIAPRLRDECETYARQRRALVILPDGILAVYYDEWLEWREPLEASAVGPMASLQLASDDE